MTVQNKIIVFICGILFCLFLGWKANTVYTGYTNEKVLLQQEAVTESIRQSQATIASEFEKQRQDIKDLAKSNTNTTTTIIKNNQPIYSTQCITQDAIDQLKKYKEDSK